MDRALVQTDTPFAAAAVARTAKRFRTNPMAAIRSYSTGWQTLLLLTDILAFFASFYVAVGLVERTLSWKNYAALIGGSAWLSVGLWIVMFGKLGLYRSSQALTSRDEIYYIAGALSIGIIPQLLLFTLVPQFLISRLLLIVAVGAAILLVGGSRAIVHAASTAQQRSSARRVLIVTFGSDSASEPDAAWDAAHRIPVVYVSDLRTAVGDSPQAILERTAWFRAAAREECDSVFVAGLLDPADAAHVISLSTRHGIKVAFAPPELRRSGYDLRLDREGRQVVLAPVSLSILSAHAEFYKSLFDKAVALSALVVLSPVLLITALAIRLEGAGPIFFRQERCGRHGRRFEVFKFRSMQVGAGDSWVTHNDTRVTRVGAILRKLSIDELPQLLNVLRGEMSLVGPRPEMCSYVEKFSSQLPRYADRHLVRPGITGWAQIYMRRNLTTDDIEEVLGNDLFYIENWSFLLDLSIIFKTASEFLFHHGV